MCAQQLPPPYYLIYKTVNLGDISKVNPKEVPDHDLVTFSFPCQSFSNAGNGLGIEDIRGTLALYAIEIIREKKPKYFLFENVKGLMSEKHQPFLKLILKTLSDIGYSVTLDVLNAKDFGVPQSRERIFGIGVLKD